MCAFEYAVKNGFDGDNGIYYVRNGKYFAFNLSRCRAFPCSKDEFFKQLEKYNNTIGENND